MNYRCPLIFMNLGLPFLLAVLASTVADRTWVVMAIGIVACWMLSCLDRIRDENSSFPFVLLDNALFELPYSLAAKALGPALKRWLKLSASIVVVYFTSIIFLTFLFDIYPPTYGPGYLDRIFVLTSILVIGFCQSGVSALSVRALWKLGGGPLNRIVNSVALIISFALVLALSNMHSQLTVPMSLSLALSVSAFWLTLIFYLTKINRDGAFNLLKPISGEAE